MRNKKRFMALALAAVLTLSQVNVVAPVATAGESEETTEAVTEAESQSDEVESDETEVESDSETVTEAETNTETEMDTEIESEKESETEFETEAETDTETETQSDTETETSTETETETEADNSGEEDESDEDGDEESWWIDISWPKDTNELLVGETVTAVIYLQHHYYYEEEDDGWWTTDTVPVDDYTCVVGGYDSETASVSYTTAEDGYGLELNVKGLEDGHVTIPLRFYSDGNMVFKDSLDFYVTSSGYYYLAAETSDGIAVPLGEDYNVEDAGWTLYYVSYNDGDSETIKVEDGYHLSVDGWEDYCFESLDGMTLTKRIHTDDTYADVVAYSDENDEWLAGTRILFDWLDYDIELSLTDEHLNEYQDCIVYGYEQTVEVDLNEDSTYSVDDLPEGYEVVWEIYDDTGLVNTVSSDVNSMTVELTDGDREYDGWWSGISADVYYNGNWVCGDDIWFEIVIPYVDYDSIGDRTLVVNENDYIDQYSIGYSLRSYENPWGESGSVRITDMSVAEQYTWDEEGNPVEAEETIVSVEWNGESGWDICPQIAGGYAVISYTYEGVDGLEETYTFTVYVNGDRYYLNYDYLDDTTEMLVGETKYINISLEYVFTNENGDPESYTIEDYVNQGYTLYYEYNEDLFTVETDGTQLVVTAKEETGGDEIYIAILAKDENGDSYQVAEDWIWVNVSDDYWTLEVTGPENVGIGETISLSDFDCVLTNWYSSEEVNYSEEVEIDGSKYRVILSWYDDNWWNVVEGTEENAFPQLIRRGEWDASLNLQAQWYDEEDGEWYYLADCNATFAWVDYSTELSASYNGIETSNIYANDPVTITLKDSWRNEYLIPEDCDIVWSYEVSAYDEENDEWYTPEDVNVEITGSEDGRSIALRVDTADVYVDVYADVYYDGNLFVGAGIGLWTTDTVMYEADAWAEVENDYGYIFPGDSVNIVGTITEYSSTYPDGNTTDMEIIRVECVRQLLKDEDGSWYEDNSDLSMLVSVDGTTVTGISEGYAALAVCYTDANGEEACYKYAWVIIYEDMYYLEPVSVVDDVYLYMSTGETSESLNYTLYHSYRDENGNVVIEEYEYAYLLIHNYDENGSPYDTSSYEDDVIYAEYDAENKVIRIEAKEEGESSVIVYAYNEDGVIYDYGWGVDVHVLDRPDAEITASDGSEAQTEYDVSYGDSFNLDLITDSDNGDGIQYKVIEGTDVVTVDADGNVNVIGVGTAVIKAYVDDGEGYYGVEITITVSADKADAVISEPYTYTTTYGTTPTLLLENKLTTGVGTLSYEVTSGDSVVSVDADGVVTILKAGTAVITISSEENDYYNAASVEVTITVKSAGGTETPDTETPSTETETPSTETETPATETEEPSTETETPATGTEEPSTETETPATETETPVTETEEPSTETESETEEPATESELETDSETLPTESETETDTETETETETESVTETESETETKTTSATESETTSTASAASSSETSATSSDGSVATGDESPIEFYVAVMLLAVCMLFTGGLYRKVRRS